MTRLFVFADAIIIRRNVMAPVLAVLGAYALLGVPEAALAIETGAYRCQIENTVLVTDSGESIAVNPAHREFTLNAFGTPGAPSLQREHPLRRLDYYQEVEVATAASVEPKLFSGPTTDLRSEDGVVYVQAGNVFRFTGEGRFIASGQASFPNDRQGLAVYTGECNRQ